MELLYTCSDVYSPFLFPNEFEEFIASKTTSFLASSRTSSFNNDISSSSRDRHELKAFSRSSSTSSCLSDDNDEEYPSCPNLFSDDYEDDADPNVSNYSGKLKCLPDQMETKYEDQCQLNQEYSICKKEENNGNFDEYFKSGATGDEEKTKDHRMSSKSEPSQLTSEEQIEALRFLVK